jgi:Rieske 2Fe-2S family protein
MASKTYAKGGVLVPSEHHIAAFHDWVQEKVGDIAPTGEVRMGLTAETAPLEERAETLKRYESPASRAS